MKTTFLAAIAVSAILLSCKKTEVVQESPISNEQGQFGITNAKQFIDATAKKVVLFSGGKYFVNGATSNPDEGPGLILDWVHAITSSNDSISIVEIPVASPDGKFGFIASHGYSDERLLKSVTRLVVQQDNAGHIKSRLMTIIGDSSYMVSKNYNLSGNTLLTKDADFTGTVLFNYLDGSFSNGWKYKNGKVTNTVNQSPTVPVNGVAMPGDNGCIETVVSTYTQDCVDHYSNGVYVNTDCSQWYISHQESYISCNGGAPIPNPNGGGGIGGDGNGNATSVCETEALNFLNMGEVQSGTEVMETGSNTGTEWKVKYNWVIFKAGTWGLVSYENATMTKHDLGTYQRWEYTAFDHDKISSIGVNIGGSRTFEDIGATINITPTRQTAFVRIDFKVYSTPADCGIIKGATVDQAFNANKVFHAPLN